MMVMMMMIVFIKAINRHSAVKLINIIIIINLIYFSGNQFVVMWCTGVRVVRSLKLILATRVTQYTLKALLA